MGYDEGMTRDIPHKPSLLLLSPERVSAWLQESGAPPYRAGQLLEWVYAKRAASFDDMLNLPKPLRDALAAAFVLDPLACVHVASADRGATRKFLFELTDGARIESVSMRDGDRHTFCISSQVGCALGCVFCATGAMGFTRDLDTAEILGQVRWLAREAGALRNIVFMGMGEPLLNLDALLPAMAALTDPERMGLSPRRVTLSTCGILPGVEELTRLGTGVRLAVSIGSPFDEERTELMAVNRKYPLSALIRTCEAFAQQAKRRLTLEYVVLADVNDSAGHARALGRLARRLRAKVNLIGHNPVPGHAFQAPSPRVMHRLRADVLKTGAEAVIRFRRGRDIEAACGQLRAAEDRPRSGASPRRQVEDS